MDPKEILPWIFGIIVFGVPAVALSVRIAARPLLEGLAHLRQAGHPALSVPAPDPRVEALQAEMTALRERVERLGAVEEFYAQLQAPGGATPVSVRTPPPLQRG